jgi:hypothetical protein
MAVSRAHSPGADSSPCSHSLVRARDHPPLLLLGPRPTCAQHRLPHDPTSRQTSARCVLEATAPSALIPRLFLRRYSSPPPLGFLAGYPAPPATWVHGHHTQYLNYASSAPPGPWPISTSRQYFQPRPGLSADTQHPSSQGPRLHGHSAVQGQCSHTVLHGF